MIFINPLHLNSFLHLLTDEKAIAFFGCVKQHMHSNSRFIIDIFVPNPIYIYRPDNTRINILEYTDSMTRELRFVDETNKYGGIARGGAIVIRLKGAK